MNNVGINIKNSAGNIVGKLDIGEAELNLVYQIADLREPDKKQSSFSYPFTIPGTKNNNKIFQQIYENGFSSFQYNPNKKLDAQIILNGNEFFKGDLQLNSIDKIDNKIVGYEVTIYGKIPSFFDDISDYELKDLIDLSDFNHPYTRASITKSWDTYVIQNNTQVGFQLGRGYVYPMEYKGQNNPTYWKVEDYKPSIYLKTIFDKIIQSQGFTYQSDFLNSRYFRSLILPYNGDDQIELTNEQVENYTVWAKYPEAPNDVLIHSAGSTTGQTYLNKKFIFTDDTNNPANDVGNNYNPLTGILTVPKNGKWNLTSTVKLQALFTGQAIGSSTIYPYLKIFGGQLEGTIKLRNIDTGATLASTNFTFTQSNINGNAQATPVKSDIIEQTVSYTGYLAAGTKIQVFLDWRTTGSNYTYKTKGQVVGGIWMQKNTEIQIKVISKEVNTTYNPSGAPRLILSLIEKNVAEGDTLDMNFFIPDIKAVDIINETTKLFNLYWTTTGEKSFRIEPRNTFYNSGDIRDWTYKVDNNETVSIQPLYDLTNKIYEFSYTEDNDYYNEDYQEIYDEIFGSKTLDIENDFVVDTLEIKSGFSPTPAVQYLSTDRVMPSYVKKEGDVMKVFTPKMRILFYGGTLNTTTQWFFKNPYTGEVFGRTTATLPGGGKTQFPFTVYPYAGHINNPANPVWDLNWGVPKKIYYNWNNVTTNTLFNMFWRDYIEEIVDKNSHLLTATVILNDYDIINLDLRCLIQVDNVYYRINKITHNPLTGVAEIELFRAKDTPKRNGSTTTSSDNGNTSDGSGNPFPEAWTITGDNIGDFASETNGSSLYKNELWSISSQSWGEVKPKGSFYPMQAKDANGNFYSPQAAQRVVGQYNSIDPSAFAVEIKGSNNIIMEGVQNVSITGEGNIINSGIKNVTVVGDNQSISESNVSYINGVVIRNNDTKKKITILKSPTNSSGVDVCVISGGKNSVKADKIYRG